MEAAERKNGNTPGKYRSRTTLEDLGLLGESGGGSWAMGPQSLVKDSGKKHIMAGGGSMSSSQEASPADGVQPNVNGLVDVQGANSQSSSEFLMPSFVENDVEVAQPSTKVLALQQSTHGQSLQHVSKFEMLENLIAQPRNPTDLPSTDTMTSSAKVQTPSQTFTSIPEEQNRSSHLDKDDESQQLQPGTEAPGYSKAVDERKFPTPPLISNAEKHGLSEKENPRSSKPEKLDASAEHDELSLPSCTPGRKGVSDHKSRNKLKRKADDACNANFESDDADVGLPKEQYKPRPSRSRASHAIDDLVLDIDFSKRPEATIKAKAKRRKTTGNRNLLDDKIITDEADNVDDRENLRSDASAMRKSETVEHTAKLFVAPDAPLPIGDQVQKKKRGRPKKVANEEESARDTLAEPGTTTENDIDIPKPESTTTLKKTRKRKKTDDDSQNREDIPRKEDIMMSSVNPITNDDNLLGALDLLEDQRNETNSITSRMSPPNEPQTLPRETPPPTTKPTLPAQTPKNPASSSIGRHSPLNSSRVPYRVGLSRRHRIEPLLRAVRK